MPSYILVLRSDRCADLTQNHSLSKLRCSKQAPTFLPCLPAIVCSAAPNHDVMYEVVRRSGRAQCIPAVNKAVMQQLPGVVQPVPNVTEHHPEGLSHWDRVPEVCIVLALALLCQHVRILSLLAAHLLRQGLHTHPAHPLSASCNGLLLKGNRFDVRTPLSDIHGPYALHPASVIYQACGMMEQHTDVRSHQIANLCQG